MVDNESDIKNLHILFKYLGPIQHSENMDSTLNYIDFRNDVDE